MKVLFKDLSRGNQLLYLLGVALLSLVVFGILSSLLLHFVFHVSFAHLTGFSDIHDVRIINGLKASQLINSIALFIVPAFIFAYTTRAEPLKYLNLKNPPKLKFFILVLLIMFLLYPFLNWMTLINSHMHLPASMSGVEQWMKAAEKRADNLSKLFLQSQDFGQFLVNLFVIAIIPAIGEELLFRGVLQRIFSEATNIHWGIIITAILFSAAHLQFFGFLPRFFFGVLFGYLYVMTRSLWITIFAHFINNGAVVFIYYLVSNQNSLDSTSNFGGNSITLVLGSIIVSAGIFLLIVRFCKERDGKLELRY